LLLLLLLLMVVKCDGGGGARKWRGVGARTWLLARSIYAGHQQQLSAQLSADHHAAITDLL